MIEVTNYNPIDKGSLKAVCDVRIVPWKMTLCEVKIFENGENRWITLPSKDYEGADGVKKYVELITFDSSSVKDRFRKQIMNEIDKFFKASGGTPVAEDVIKTEDDLPF